MADTPWTPLDDRFGDSNATTIKAAGDLVETTEHVENAEGVQTEFEERHAAAHPWYSGAYSGMTPTEDDTNDNVDVAAGTAIMSSGKRASGGVSISLVGQSSGTLYAYIDASASSEATAYLVSSSIPSTDDLLLARMTWDGSSVISSFTNLLQWGTQADEFSFSQATDATAAPASGKIIASFMACGNLCIRRPYARLHTCGTAGTNYVDIHTGAAGSTATIWATASDRLTIANSATDGTYYAGGLPDQNYLVSAGQVVEVHMDTTATSAYGLDVMIPYTRY